MINNGDMNTRDELGNGDGLDHRARPAPGCPWHHETDLSKTHRRPPTDYDAERVLLREMRCLNGEVQIELDCEPMLD